MLPGVSGRPILASALSTDKNSVFAGDQCNDNGAALSIAAATRVAPTALNFLILVLPVKIGEDYSGAELRAHGVIGNNPNNLGSARDRSNTNRAPAPESAAP